MSKYRRLYESITGIKVPKDFSIHHIDGNHENNEFNNLVALPCILHKTLHVVQELTDKWLDYRDYLCGKKPNHHKYNYNYKTKGRMPKIIPN